MSFRLLVFIIIFVFDNRIHAATCEALGKRLSPRGPAEVILKETQLASLSENSNNFCNANMLRRYLLVNSKDKAAVERMSDAEVKKAVERKKVDEGGFVSLPLEAHKRLLASQGILFPGSSSSSAERTFDQTLAKAEKILVSDPCSFSSGNDNVFAKTFESVSKDNGAGLIDVESIADHYTPASVKKIISPKVAKDLVTAGLQAVPAIACMEFVGPLQAGRCSKGVLNMQNKMVQKGIPPLTSMPDLLDGIINSGKFDKGLNIAARKMIERAKHPDSISSDLFTDVKRSFEESGSSTAEAEAMTFETLGMIATGGAALGQRLTKFQFDGHRWPTVTALTTIASLTPYLDFHAAEKGNLYSFPPGVKGSCDTSKSYHFWMSAYLARSEVWNGSTSAEAAVAAFTASKAYHVVGNLTNRSGAGALLQQKPFSPADLIVRADLSYASAGALFGAGIKTDKAIDVDEGMASSIRESEVLPTMNSLEAREATQPLKRFGYGAFKDRFAPNEIFRAQIRNRTFNDIENHKEVRGGAPSLAICKGK